MIGRTPAEAVNNYVSAANRLVSCITNSVVDVAGGYYLSPIPHDLTINNGQPLALGGTSNLMLKLLQSYRIADSGEPGNSWAVRVVAYNYVVYDSQHREMLIYHWHPRGHSPISTPHLHLKQGALVNRPELIGAHLPTGPISLESILRLLIRDLAVQPVRTDWESILDVETSVSGLYGE